MYKSELRIHKKHQYPIVCFGPNFFQKKSFWEKLKAGNCTFVKASLSEYAARCIDTIKVDRYIGDYNDYYESLEYNLQYGDGDY